MANYHEMDRDALTAEKAALEQAYKEFQAKGLKLNMARGKPGPHQMDLAMDLLKMTDYTTDAGTDARNYGELEGLSEARALFADVFGVKPNEVFVGGNSSLQLMYNLINIGYVFGFPESPCPWSQVEKRKFLCPVPGYDRHFAITEEFGFELISVPMTPNGPDMDVVEKLVAEDDTIKGIWCVPQYSNPDGYTYSDETIERFAKMKTAAPDFKIFWDEAYIVHHLTEEIIETPAVSYTHLDVYKRQPKEHVSLSLPSLRVDNFSQSLIEKTTKEMCIRDRLPSVATLYTPPCAHAAPALWKHKRPASIQICFVKRAALP